jgi:thiol reductant ABC exporter CydD subunit
MRDTQRRLFRESRTARGRLAAAGALGLFQAALMLVQAVALARVVARVASDGAGLDDLRGELLALGLAIAGRAILAVAFETAGRSGAQKVMSELRLRLARQALQPRPAGALPGTAGELATLAVEGVDALEAFFARYLPQLALAMLVPVAVLAYVAPLDAVSAAVMAVTVPVIVLFMILIGRLAERSARARWSTLSTLGGRFLDAVRGAVVLRAHGREQAEAQALAGAGDAYRRETMATLRVAFLSALVLELAAALGTALVAVTLGVRLVGGSVSLEAALTVLLLAPELYAPIRSLGAQFHATADGLAAAERLFEALDVPPALAAVPAGAPPAPDPGRQPVRLECVTVRYADRPAPALERVDLELRPGEMVALVGPSGAGKSTLAALLVRLLDPTEGRILVGGRDLRSLDPDEWRRLVAWAPQRPRVFAATLAENVRMGRPGASDADVRGALRAAGADELVARLPDGLATRLGEGGRPLSAGEAQRVGIARAVVRDAGLVVLDEPTASLDPEGARALGMELRRLLRGHTVLLVSHRPEPVAFADRVVRLDRGRLTAAVAAAAA